MNPEEYGTRHPEFVSRNLNHNHRNQAHLNQDQIDDHLIGDPASVTAAHLAECELCVARVAETAAPIEAFKTVSLAWSERRSATLPLHQAMASWGARRLGVRSLGARSLGARSARFYPRVAWAAAVAAALAVGVALPVVSHQNSIQERQQTARQTARLQQQMQPVTTAANNAGDEIVRDNQMLQAIDRELDTASESPEALGLKPVSGRSVRKVQPLSSVQD